MNVEQRARELLAEEYKRVGLPFVANLVRAGGHDEIDAIALRAIARALEQPEGREAVCTCPSGDGSLRWPCPKHPPQQQEKK